MSLFCRIHNTARYNKSMITQTQTIKEQLLEILLRKWRRDPEDEALAEFYAEVSNDEYSEDQMQKFLKHEKHSEVL